MCEPTTLAVISIGATALSTVNQMQGQAAAGKAAQANAEYQAQIAENNRVIALRNQEIQKRNIEASQRNQKLAYEAAQEAEAAGEDALRRGDISAEQARREKNRLIGRQRAVMAANGVLVDDGTALDIIGDTAEIGKLDELTIKANAGREYKDYRLRSDSLRAEGANFGLEAENFATTAANYGTEAGSFSQTAAAQRASGAYAVSAARHQQVGTALSGIGSVATKWYGFYGKGAS